jgi:hypothetical protein
MIRISEAAQLWLHFACGIICGGVLPFFAQKLADLIALVALRGGNVYFCFPPSDRTWGKMRCQNLPQTPETTSKTK